MIPATIVWALEMFSASFVEIDCKNYDKEKVAKEFDETFKDRWEEAYKRTMRELDVEDDDDYYPQTAEDGYPANVRVVNQKVIAIMDPLIIPYCYGDFCEIQLPCDALTETMTELSDKFPDIEYDGLVAFPWSDRRCGDVEIFPISSHSIEDKTYPLLKDILEAAMKGETLFGFSCADEDGEFSFCGKLQEELEGVDIDDYEEFADFINEYEDIFTPQITAKLVEIMKIAAENTRDAEIIEFVEKYTDQ